VPLVICIQVAISPSVRGAGARAAFLAVMLIFGHWETLRPKGHDVWIVAGFLGAAYAIVFWVAHLIAQAWRTRSGKSFAILGRLAQHPSRLMGLWIAVPIISLVIAAALQPILDATLGSYSSFADGPQFRVYSIPPFFIRIAVFLNWLGFVVFSVAAGIGLLVQKAKLCRGPSEQADRVSKAHERMKHLALDWRVAILLLPLLGFVAYWGLAIALAMLGITTDLLAELVPLFREIGFLASTTVAIIGSIALPIYVTALCIARKNSDGLSMFDVLSRRRRLLGLSVAPTPSRSPSEPIPPQRLETDSADQESALSHVLHGAELVSEQIEYYDDWKAAMLREFDDVAVEVLPRYFETASRIAKISKAEWRSKALQLLKTNSPRQHGQSA